MRTWLPLIPRTVTVTLSPIMSASPTRRVRISMLASPSSPAFLSERAKMIAQHLNEPYYVKLPRRCAIQPVGPMERSHRALEIPFRDQHADLDLRRGDEPHVDALVAQRLEQLRRDARVRAHAGPDYRELRDAIVACDRRAGVFRGRLARQLERAGVVVAVHGEAEVD